MALPSLQLREMHLRGEGTARKLGSTSAHFTHMLCRLDDGDRYVTMTFCAFKFHNVNEAWKIRNMLQANTVEHHQCFL